MSSAREVIDTALSAYGVTDVDATLRALDVAGYEVKAKPIFDADTLSSMFIEWCALHHFGTEGWPEGSKDYLMAMCEGRAMVAAAGSGG